MKMIRVTDKIENDIELMRKENKDIEVMINEVKGKLSKLVSNNNNG